MREIKFRGKTKDGRWVQGVPIKNGFGKLTFMCFATSDLLSCPMEQIYKFCIEVIPETVTQYTGLKDKNGIEIYEGDIVEAYSQSVKGTLGVKWRQEGSPSWILFPAWQSSQMWHLYAVETEKGKYQDSVTVIGNRYENPELLKEEPTC